MHASWLAWFGGALAVAFIAFLVGLTGLFGGRAAPPADVDLIGAIATGIEALDCPAGEPVARLLPGDRVYVVGRSADSVWVAVRSAAGSYETVWVAAAAIRLDDVEATLSVPIDGCLDPLPVGGAG